MTSFEELVESIRPLTDQVQALYNEVARQYEPEVDAIIRSGCREVNRIEQVLDGLLSFGDDETCLRLFKRLCRHYWTIDHIAAAEYVMIYREHWDPRCH